MQIALAAAEDGSLSTTLEMVAPTYDESGYWIADHPTDAPPGARVRLFSVTGEPIVSFQTPAGTTMFTPGFDGDMWVIRSAGATPNETLLHYSGTGTLAGEYQLTDGLLARAIFPMSDGSVWVMSEEWFMDSETFMAQYRARLLPILSAGGTVVENQIEESVDGTFIGHNGRVYSLKNDPTNDVSEYPVFDVTSTDLVTGEVSTFRTSGGLRPYMADAEGRVYAESLRPSAPDAPGISILGDQAVTQVDVDVLDRTSDTGSRLSVQPSALTGGWAPAVWPSPAGRLYSARWDQGKLLIMRSERSTPASPAAIAEERPVRAEARILAPFEAPVSGDPYAAIDDFQRDVWQLVYSGLVSRDASAVAVPDLAAAVPGPGAGVSDDGLTITWRLAPGRLWHDGTPVTAADVRATWSYLRRQGLLGKREPFPGFDIIRSVEADGEDVVVRLSEPFGIAPECFFPFVLPAHVIEGAAATTNGGLYSLPIGSGPFRVVRWEQDGTMMLAAHEDTGGRPELDRIDVEFGKRTGLADTYALSPIPTFVPWLLPEERETVKRDQVGEIVPSETGRWTGLLFNVTDGVMSDGAVRQAVASLYPFATALAIHGPPEGAPLTVGPFQTAREPIPAERLSSDPSTDTATALLEQGDWQLSQGGKRSKAGVSLDISLSLASRAGFPHEIPSEVFDPAVKRLNSVGADARWNTSTTGFYSAPSDAGYLTQHRHQVSTGVFRMPLDPAWGSMFDPADSPGWDRPWAVAVTGTDDAELRDLHAAARRSYDPAERARLGRLIGERVQELDLAVFEYPETRYAGVLGIEGYMPGHYPAGDFWNVDQWKVRERE
jgi:peptide/nickel transport system substrate-binding protein